MPNCLITRVLVGAVCCMASFFLSPVVQAQEASLTVFAAASTTNALSEIAQLYEAAGQGKVTFSFASSSTLAKQIEHGAPVDIFLSANQKWMDYLADKKHIHQGSRANILANTLVLIAPTGSAVQHVNITPTLDLAGLLGKEGKLAVGDPAHVPVGMYAQAALEKLGLWQQVAERIAPTKDVRAGMFLVEQEEALLGIVYGSDAAISQKVKVVGVFPTDSHEAIVYPIAIVDQAKHLAAAQKFIAFLHTPEAQAIWKKYGFVAQ